MTIKDRIIQYIDYKGLSKRGFSDSIGRSNSYVNNIVSTISADVINSIKEKYPELNIHWLLTGEESMLIDKPEDGFKDRLREIMEEEGYSRSILSKTTGIHTTTITNWLTGKTAPDDSKLDLISDLFGVTAEWLKTGQGNKYKPHSGEVISDLTPYNRQDLERDKIPFFDDVVSVGGYNAMVADCNTTYVPSEYIDAGDWFPEATAAIRHYGDSMIEYASGSILAIKRVTDRRLLIWGRNYVVETSEYRITKQLQQGPEGYIIAYSTNMETYPDGRQIHSPIQIPLDAVRHIDVVLGCVKKEYSSGALNIVK